MIFGPVRCHRQPTTNTLATSHSIDEFWIIQRYTRWTYNLMTLEGWLRQLILANTHTRCACVRLTQNGFSDTMTFLDIITYYASHIASPNHIISNFFLLHLSYNVIWMMMKISTRFVLQTINKIWLWPALKFVGERFDRLHCISWCTRHIAKAAYQFQTAN